MWFTEKEAAAGGEEAMAVAKAYVWWAAAGWAFK